jgi:hypothetical protein
MPGLGRRKSGASFRPFHFSLEVGEALAADPFIASALSVVGAGRVALMLKGSRDHVGRPVR